MRHGECIAIYNTCAHPGPQSVAIYNTLLLLKLANRFYPSGLFSSRVFGLCDCISKPQTTQSNKKQTRFLVCSFSMGFFKLRKRCEKRPIGRNDLLISKARIYCKLQYIVAWGARMYCKLQHILHVATNFRCGHLLNRKMPPLSEIEDRLQKACLERSESYSKTIDLTKRLPLSLEPFLLEGRQRFH